MDIKLVSRKLNIEEKHYRQLKKEQNIHLRNMKIEELKSMNEKERLKFIESEIGYFLDNKWNIIQMEYFLDKLFYEGKIVGSHWKKYTRNRMLRAIPEPLFLNKERNKKTRKFIYTLNEELITTNQFKTIIRRFKRKEKNKL